jgi:hypothetical protein
VNENEGEDVSGVDWGVIFWIAAGLYAILSAVGLVLLGRTSAAR